MSDRAFVYAAMVLGTLAISLDFASVDLALPALETHTVSIWKASSGSLTDTSRRSRS
jgi:hypothetical protein